MAANLNESFSITVKKQKQNELCEIYCESRYLEETEDKKGIRAK